MTITTESAISVSKDSADLPNCLRIRTSTASSSSALNITDEMLFPLTFAALFSVVSCLFHPPQPTVTIKNGTVIGTSSGDVEKFLGLPYALPPVNDRRLRRPEAITTTFGTLMATAAPSYCPQYKAASGSNSTPASGISLPPDGASLVAALLNPVPASSQSEDCLYLSVQRPSGVNNNSSVPVVVWVHGGAFQTGGSALYNADAMLSKAKLLNEPLIFVAINYRLSSFGFLPGGDLSEEGNTNLGLRDQRAALQWIAENIAAFGGDPSKVTLWGESAGSWSVTDHTLMNGGDNSYNGTPLFRAVIGNSGSIYPAQDVRSTKAQGIFDGFVQRAGCSAADDKLACLRKVPYDQFLAAQNSIDLGGGSVNFPYVARPDAGSQFFAQSPELAVAAGQFARVPLLAFDQEDEGTLFGIVNSGPYRTNQDLLDFWKPVFTEAQNQTLTGLFDLYSAALSAGSPYRTGALNEIYPGYKRISSMAGDVLFIHMRRIYLDTVASTANVWSGIGTYNHALIVLGTTHATDVLAAFYGIGSPLAIDEILTRWISFINHNDPNQIGQRIHPWYAAWPRYDTQTRQLLSINVAGTSAVKDDFRSPSYNYLKAHISEFRI